MFDVGGALPRQGCAVFVDEIRRFTDDEGLDRLVTHTMAHEVGHALNLVHRFERPVGRSASPSPMNYFWRYRGGNREQEYWEQFVHRFDPDEVQFLRHAPRASVMPGMSPFHGVDYWAGAPGAYPAFVPGTPTPGFRLVLDPPPSGPRYAFGQPVYLQVSLQNTGESPAALPPSVLDVKAGYLEILIERVNGPGGRPVGPPQAFVPVVQRCVDFTPGPRRLQPQEVWYDNVNLTFGSSGFAMAEPGGYRLTPLVTIGDPESDAGALVIRGESRAVWVNYPASAAAEAQAIDLLQPEVGAWFALGGSDVLSDARTVVEEIRGARMHEDPADPIAAAITRTLGIEASRTYVRSSKRGEFGTRDPDTDRAVDLLTALVADPGAMGAFDRSTASATRKLPGRIREGRLWNRTP
jgi:hypothetical protein